MAKIYREVEDIQEPTPRPEPVMKQQPAAEPFDSQKAYGELKEGFSGLSERVEAMGNDVADFRKKFDEKFGAPAQPGDELEGEESTDAQDADGEKIADVNKTKSAAPVQKNFEKLSKRKSIVGSSAKETFNVKESVRNFVKGFGGMM